MFYFQGHKFKKNNLERIKKSSVLSVVSPSAEGASSPKVNSRRKAQEVRDVP